MDQAERSYASAMALAQRLRLPEIMLAVSQAYAQHAMRTDDIERAANTVACNADRAE
jgi:hypothetical protein